MIYFYFSLKSKLLYTITVPKIVLIHKELQDHFGL